MKRHRSRQPKASQNPSPSGDPWYDVPENLAHVREAEARLDDDIKHGRLLRYISREQMEQHFRDLGYSF